MLLARRRHSLQSCPHAQHPVCTRSAWPALTGPRPLARPCCSAAALEASSSQREEADRSSTLPSLAHQTDLLAKAMAAEAAAPAARPDPMALETGMLLQQYRALRQEVAPWVAEFRRAHGRQPGMADVEAAAAAGLCAPEEHARLQAFIMARNRLWMELPALRARLSSSSSSGSQPPSSSGGSKAETAALKAARRGKGKAPGDAQPSSRVQTYTQAMAYKRKATPSASAAAAAAASSAAAVASTSVAADFAGSSEAADTAPTAGSTQHSAAAAGEDEATTSGIAIAGASTHQDHAGPGATTDNGARLDPGVAALQPGTPARVQSAVMAAAAYRKRAAATGAGGDASAGAGPLQAQPKGNTAGDGSPAAQPQEAQVVIETAKSTVAQPRRRAALDSVDNVRLEDCY